MRLVVGADPGKAGALAAVDLDTLALVAADDMPLVGKGRAGKVSAPLIWHWVTSLPGEVVGVAVESVGPRPHESPNGAFQFGRATGIVIGVLAPHWPTVEITSPVWKAAYHLRGKDKAASRAAALGLWPGSASLFARVKDDGRAEAALIARYHALTLRTPEVAPSA